MHKGSIALYCKRLL